MGGEAVIVQACGGGVQSSALTALAANRDPRLADTIGGDVDAVLFANVGDDSEHPDALAWTRDVLAPYCAERDMPFHELHRVRRDGLTETLFEKLHRTPRSIDIPVRMANGAPGRRSCTADFKINLIATWTKANGATPDDPATVLLGISTDEIERAGRVRRQSHEVSAFPLIEMGWSRDACQAHNVTTFGRPAPKSSCWFCPFHRPQTWAEMRRDEPDLFARAVELERMLNKRRETLTCSGTGSFGVATLGGVKCNTCKRFVAIDDNGQCEPHGVGRVWLTRFNRPLDEAITESQTPLFEGDGHSIGESGCDEGVCFV